MAKLPDKWMPMYIGDYLRDTSRLTRDQHGGYLLLIFDYWINGPLPDDDRALAAIAKASAEEWVILRPILSRFFRISRGVWRHKRIEQERVDAEELSDKRSNAGKTGAKARWQKDGKRIGVSSQTKAKGSDRHTPSPSPSFPSTGKKEDQVGKDTGKVVRHPASKATEYDDDPPFEETG